MFQDRAREIVEELNPLGPWAAKDPRLCFLFPWWREVLERPACVLISDLAVLGISLPLLFSAILWQAAPFPTLGEDITCACYSRVNTRALSSLGAGGLRKEGGVGDVKQNRFPPGWDEERFRRVLAHYEEQTEAEAVAEDEAAFEDRTQTVMEIPTELMPAVRELIARHGR